MPRVPFQPAPRPPPMPAPTCASRIPALAVEATTPSEPPADALAVFLAATTAAARPDIGAASEAIVLPFRWLGGTSRAETWRAGHPVVAEWARDGSGIRLAFGADFQFGHLVVELSDAAVEDATEAAYRTALRLAADAGYPHLLRVWNYFGAINDGDGDAERYRRFCVGRARAIPREPATGYAAATAIGIPGAHPLLHLAWIAGREPGVPVENPRQVSAWEYPRDYGPVAPGFSRAMLIERNAPPILLVSGTASVVGHESRHAEALAQLDEALTNVERVLERAAARLGRESRLGAGSTLRVYVRHAADAPAIRRRLLERLGGTTPFMLLEGDICRRELLVEIEAVHAFGP